MHMAGYYYRSDEEWRYDPRAISNAHRSTVSANFRASPTCSCMDYASIVALIIRGLLRIYNRSKLSARNLRTNRSLVIVRTIAVISIHLSARSVCLCANCIARFLRRRPIIFSKVCRVFGSPP